LVPGEARPLATYIDPYSEAYRCPEDNGATPWTYGLPRWDYGTTSYTFNYLPAFENAWLYGRTTSEVRWPSITGMTGDNNWGSTRHNLPANDLAFFTNDPRAWWHPRAFKERLSNIAFVDGHVDYVHVEILISNTDRYRREP